MDCGPTCLRMISKYYGKEISRQQLNELTGLTRMGVSLLDLASSSEDIGFKSLVLKINFKVLQKKIPLPCIALVDRNHFVVIYAITKTHVKIVDPAKGKISLRINEFTSRWINDEVRNEGLILAIEPTRKFKDIELDSSEMSWKTLLWPYVAKEKKSIFYLLLILIFTTAIQVIVPFLTQSIVDRGINYQDVDFIKLILVAQIVLYFSQASVFIFRDWILLFFGSKINLALQSDFVVKLTQLPVPFFENRKIGDILERVNDHRRVKGFLSFQTLNIAFAIFNLVIFGIVLLYFMFKIFLYYLIGTVAYILWVLIFLRKRAELDTLAFKLMSSSQNKIIGIINGVKEIKLNNSFLRRRWSWERIQVELHNYSIRDMKLTQYQRSGGMFISEIKNILISYVSAMAVIEGQLTLGGMLAISYIIGRLNSPISMFVGFVQTFQEAKLSLDRILDVHNEKDENDNTVTKPKISTNTLEIKNLSFKYLKNHSDWILKDINLKVEAGELVAIVGASGSGKSTLLKLLLKFYAPNEGDILIGGRNLAQVDSTHWRTHCGVVMQDGFIFDDTIKRNITESKSLSSIDEDRLESALEISNLKETIEGLPMKEETEIGRNGMALSGGQLQRILIARAIYKNPEFLFFDEATSSLDSINEREIMDKLHEFYENRTVLVIAHRLSTVKKAKKILVLSKGEIVEEGNHYELLKKKGSYYELVVNQLES